MNTQASVTLATPKQPQVRELLENIWQDPERASYNVRGPKGDLKLKFRIEV